MTEPTPEDIYYVVAHRSQAEIDSFQSRYQDFDTTLIPQIFKQALGLEATDWRQSSSWGSSHVIFFVAIKGSGKRLVLRANLGMNPQPETAMKIEELVTDKVAALNIPTNKVLHVDISRRHFPFDFQIQEELAGQDLEDHFSGTQKAYDAMSFELGRYIAQYQAITLPGFGLFDPQAAKLGKLQGTKQNFFDYIVVRLDEDIAYLVDAGVISAQKGKDIRHLFDERREIISIEKGSLVHHDLADHNLMFKDDTLTGIFDWETALVGDPVLDLASCPTWKTHYPREQKLIEGYSSVIPLPANFEEKMNIYRLRTILWKTVYVIRANIMNDARKQRLFDALAPFDMN